MVSAALKVSHSMYFLNCTEENEIRRYVVLDLHIKITFNMKSEKQCTIVTQGIVTNWDIGKRYEIKLLHFLHYILYLKVN